MDDYRRHTACRDRIIFVPVPFEGGSPKEANRGRPGPYPVNRREHWRPAQHPPRLSKAERSVQLLRRICEQDQIVREFMQQAREGSQRHA
jgi:hypothetical protein